MKLRLGQPVTTTDGPFGELGDVVVDPHAGAVTHIVVEPRHQHFQARLVPITLVTEEEGRLAIGLDSEHVRQLEAVADSHFMKIEEPIALAPEWDVGIEDVSVLPYHSIDLDLNVFGDEFVVTYDRVPKGEVEIRRTSEVVSCDDETVGRVDGFVVEDDLIGAVVVSAGRPGFRHDVLLPLSAVGRVRNDRIVLSITAEEFRDLPRTDVLGRTDKLTGHVTDLRRRADSIGTRLAEQSRKLVSVATDRFGSDRPDANP